MKKLTVLLAITLLSMIVVVSGPAPVRAQDSCAHEPTIASLRECVGHAVTEGHIDNAGVAQSLFAKLDAAQAALDRGQTAVAVQLLQAFVREVQAQIGLHIDSEHGAHMVMHAQEIIVALE